MRQSTILINAALIIAKMVFNIINERNRASTQTGRKSLTDSASGILLGDGRRRRKLSDDGQMMGQYMTHNSPEAQHFEDGIGDSKTISVVGDYAYVNSGRSLVIFNISNKSNPAMVSETLF